MPPTQHGQYLHQLVRLGISNVYFVREDDGLTLIDTSVPRQAGAILAGARALGAPVRRILLTHAHTDHAGSLDALHAALPEAEVLVGEREAPILAGEYAVRPGEPKGRLVRPLYLKTKTRPTRTLAPGERVGSLEVIAAPGHTPGQIALLDTRDRTLICGDAYLSIGGLFVTNQLVARFPLPALAGTWHKPTAYATAQALRALSPNRLATGHGPVVEDAPPVMDRALAASPRS